MRQGLDLQNLADELEYQNETKRDFLVHTKAITIVRPDDTGLPFRIEFAPQRNVTHDFPISRFMMGQIATHVQIPIGVIDMMSEGTRREQKAIARLLTVRLQEHDAVRMIRTMGRFFDEPYARAFLSDRYRAIDNYDLAQAILPVAAEMKGLEVASCDVTETLLYLKFLRPEMAFDLGKTRDVKGAEVGDIIEAGIVVSNSEVGAGSLSIQPMLLRKICVNNMVINEAAIKKTHVGRKHYTNMSTVEKAWEMYSDRTRAMDDAALFAKVRDVMIGTLKDKTLFKSIATKLIASKDDKITGHPQAVVQEIGRRYSLAQDETQNVLKYLVKGGDLSHFGVVNAVTMLAGRSKSISYDRATELEQTGGKVLEITKDDWKTIGSLEMGNGTKKATKQTPQRTKTPRATTKDNGTSASA